MIRILKAIAVVFNATVLTMFGFFAFMVIDDGQAGSITLAENIELIDSKPPNIVHDDEQAMCMALNIYYESRSDNVAGQYAVADVVLNRVHDDRYPNSVCEVVKQAVTHKGTNKPVINRCSFSWFCDGKNDTPDLKSDEWYNAKRYARMVLYGTISRACEPPKRPI